MPKKKMTVPEPVQLPSGSWRLQIMLPDGVRHSITRPTQEQCLAEYLSLKTGAAREMALPPAKKTLERAMEEYIESRTNVLSPATIAGYRVIQRNRFPEIRKLSLDSLTPIRWQKAVNLEAGRVSPKTLKNSAMFVQTVYKVFTGRRLEAALPQVVRKELPWLTPDQTEVFMEAIHGSRYEIPALLLLCSLRQSELVALQWGDLDPVNRTVSVTGSAVADSKGRMILMETNKTTGSRRLISFTPPQLWEALAQLPPQDPAAYVWPHYNNVLRLNINRICESAGLPQVGLHGLRRSFASRCYHLGVPLAITMMQGGWSNPSTVLDVYTKIPDSDVQAQAQRFSSSF